MGWALSGFILGAIIGSFLATAAIRWPAGEQAATGRSRCDHCRRDLRALDLVPIISFVVRRGRCVSCGEAIDRKHLLIEIAAALMGAFAFALAPGLSGLGGAVFGWGLLLLGVLDVEHYWLPDRATGMLALLGISFGAAGAAPFPNDRLIGMAAGFLSLWLIGRGYRLVRRREGLGGGDPKLFGAIGAWLGWAALPYVLLLAGLAGLASVLLARARGQAVSATTRLPFGALLAVAAWPAWLFLFAAG